MKKDRENRNIMEKRNGSISTQKTLYQLLERAAPPFQFFTGAIKKIMKIYQE